MTESKPPSRPPVAAGQRQMIVAPLALFLAALLVAWTVGVYAIRNVELPWPWLSQVFPLLLWMAAILAWVRWQRIARPARWLGLQPIPRVAIVAAIAAFALVIAWHFIRVSLARSPGGLLAHLPAEIYVWLILGVFLNEVLFRGIVQTRLEEAFGPAVAIPAAALAGVLFRLPAFFTTSVPMPFDPLALFGVLIFGCIAGLLRHYTRSLWPGVALQWGNSLGSLL